MSLKPTPIPPIPEETARGTRAVFPRGADVVRSRLDWKYAHSLELTDPGFDHTVLSEFRTRLVAQAEEQPLEACRVAPSMYSLPQSRLIVSTVGWARSR